MHYLAILSLVSTVAAVRDDYVTEIVADNGGPWGSWGRLRFCPSGSFVYGYSLKVEERQRLRDDTALNGVELFCRSATTSSNTGSVTSTVQKWGSWLGVHQCLSNFAVWMKLKVELPQGRRDDTAANNLQMRCLNGKIIKGSAGPWGSWGSWSRCPRGSAICGLRTRVEAPQGRRDDTALNSVKMACCSLP